MKTKDVMLLIEVRKMTNNGEALRIREAARINQAELAVLVGTTRATVCRWESGVRNPAGESGVRYARTLRMLQTLV